MRLNKYTLKIENGDNTILYNLISKTLLEVDCKCEDLQSDFIDKIEQENIDFYKERLIVSENDNDDIQEMKKLKDSYNGQNYIGRYMIHLGYACNLKCSYCYQSTIQENSFRIDSDKVVDFILQTVDDNDFEVLDVCFIGGEPLLFWNEMKYISSRLNELIKGKKIEYSVVTNGTLLNEKHHLSELIELGISDYQITLDGSAKIHDQYRNDGKRGSFNQIISNIKSAKEKYPDLAITINCNLSEKNISSIENLFSFLEEKELDVPVSFSMVFDNGVNNRFECKVNNSIWKDAHLIGLRHGNEYVPFYRDLYLGCALTQKNYFVIGADGYLYKCINAVNNKKYLIDNISSYKQSDYIQKAKPFLDYEIENGSCHSCELYPICFGGCHYRNGIHGFTCEKNQFYDNDVSLIKEIVNARNK